ncbi:MAG: DMT family transporter [Ruegeria sp.]
MRYHPAYGFLLALFGALVLTPDTLLMRMSEMDGYQMLAWRGMLMGGVMLFAWAVTSKNKSSDVALLISLAGFLVVFCHFLNAALFNLAIAAAPVSIVLFAVATVPIFAAIFSQVLFGEPTSLATWVAIVAVLAGISIAVFGNEAGRIGIELNTALGALAGLSVAAAMAIYLVIIRHRPHLPILLVMGVGSLLAGLTGLAVTGPGELTEGNVWPIVLTGTVILPVSFGCLAIASRYTHASNVSLLILLETVFGPLWVWWGVGEVPTPAMLVGGAVVVGSIAVYLWTTGGRQNRGYIPIQD